MPERSYVNTAFLTMAIEAGLTMAIANPSQELFCLLSICQRLFGDLHNAALISLQNRLPQSLE